MPLFVPFSCWLEELQTPFNSSLLQTANCFELKNLDKEELQTLEEFRWQIKCMFVLIERNSLK